jgi:hypothetical protein
MHACIQLGGGGTNARSVGAISTLSDQTVPPVASSSSLRPSIDGEELMLKGDIGLTMHVQQEWGGE